MSTLPSRARRRILAACTLAAATVLCGSALAAPAADWPTRPVTLIVPFTAGGPTDIQMRALANAASRITGQPWIVNNQPSVSGTLGPASMAHTAQPDGHTLALITPSVFRLPHLQKVSYDALGDFTYLAGLTAYTQTLTVAQDSRWPSLQAFVDDAQANPGKLTVAAVGTGSLGHISVSRLQRQLGVQVNSVPYKGGSETLAAVLGEAARDPNDLRALENESMPDRFLAAADYQRYARQQFEADRIAVKDLGLALD
ncbi:tripartite tricarboxylate transporter substrate binding protein [Verticiella sediminum]|uniref:Tripartite tricarboxylate transporter substrate binding protein n=1 Tax=Verticiella sediminum TaxID=1247510 RepID=A0A556A6J9_9BURK|nr:tripartite tricarboxylate transporter substrate binding protein [Verticiella sediminum]TSH88516.1 tripartite tricarboxylate transporter substrate binding protein [Verticiella sediminum]